MKIGFGLQNYMHKMHTCVKSTLKNEYQNHKNRNQHHDQEANDGDAWCIFVREADERFCMDGLTHCTPRSCFRPPTCTTKLLFYQESEYVP